MLKQLIPLLSKASKKGRGKKSKSSIFSFTNTLLNLRILLTKPLSTKFNNNFGSITNNIFICIYNNTLGILSLLNTNNHFLSYPSIEQSRNFVSSTQSNLRVSSPKSEDEYDLKAKAERIKKMKAEERKNNPNAAPQAKFGEEEEEVKEQETTKSTTNEKSEKKEEKSSGEKTGEKQEKKKKGYEKMGDEQAKEKIRTKPNWHAYGVKYSLPILALYGLYKIFGIYAEYGFSFANLKERFDELIAPLKKPTNSKLLPDIPEGAPSKPVLVLAVEDFLITTSYNPRTGWKTQKRPGFDQFIQTLSQYYELVFFSDNYMMSVAQIIEKLDPEMIAHKLFRDATVSENGANIKDLLLLNRPVEKIIMIEHRKDAYSKQPENTLVTSPWKGDTQDRLLIEMIPFLEFVATKAGKIDVRTILQEYGNKDKQAQQIAREFNTILEQRRRERAPQASSQVQAKTEEKSSWFGLRK